MKIKSFAPLLLSTFLIPSIAGAYGELSDAYNGLIPEDVKSNATQLKKWQDEKITKFQERSHSIELTYEQVERFFSPLTRKGDDEMRRMANACCEFFALRSNKVGEMQRLFEGHRGMNVALPSASQMQDGVPSSGHHIHMLREIERISKEISENESEISKYPTKKAEYEQQIKEKEQGIKDIAIILEGIQKNKTDESSTLAQTIKEIALLENKINATQQAFDKTNTALQPLKRQGQAELEPLEKKKQELTILHKQKESELTTSKLATIIHEASESLPQQNHENLSTQTQTLVIPSEKIEENENKSLELPSEKTSDVPIVSKEVFSLEQEIEQITKDLGVLETEITKIQHKHKNLTKDLETTFEAQQKEINELIERLSECKERKKSETQKREDSELENTQKLQTLENHIRNFKALIEQQNTKVQELVRQNQQKIEEKKKLQDDADTYALTKYLTYLNIYSALPNDDFDYHEYGEWGLSTLSSHTVPLIVEFVNERADKVGSYNAREVAKRTEANYFKSNMTTTKAMISEIGPISKDIKQFMKANYLTNAIEHVPNFLECIENHLNAQKLEKSYKESNLESQRHSYWPQKIDAQEFGKESKEKLEGLRADRLIKKTMNKWRGKISTDLNSLVDRLGLKSVLFNNDFPIQTYPQVLSLFEMHKQLSQGSLLGGQFSKQEIWSLGLSQLETNFFSAFIDKTGLTYNRIQPIYHFVEKKASLPSKDIKKEKFEDKIQKGDLKEKEVLISKAFLKMISYMNMFYALRQNEKGEALPEFKSVNKNIEKYLKEPFPKSVRLDYVMAEHALKWAKRIVEHGKEFVEKYALEAHTFTSVDFLTSSKHEVKKEKQELNQN